MIKKRIFPEHNYKSFWFDGKTVRIAINSDKPITALKYPEFYDIKITGYCEGKCPWCYMDSSKEDSYYKNPIDKINTFFASMTKNERPFQVAIGGGEPTTHPEFIKILEVFKNLDIVPNYTTNGMHISNKILDASKELCGGVALSCHPHLTDYWISAAKRYIQKGILTNFHIIISDNDSIDYFIKIYSEWSDVIDYFVLLPYIPQGRASKKDINWKYLIKNLPKDMKKIAFGAGFYKYLLNNDNNIKVSLYEPEILSKFLDLKDMKVYKSSFNIK